MATKSEGASRSTFDEGDSFLSDITKLNPAYRGQLDPYLSYNYKNGIWDHIGNFFGFNTGEDRYRMEMQDRARQAYASLMNDQFQNDFNSEQARASRQRDAGLNPDLAGETSGEAAAQMEQPLTPIDPSVFEVPKEVFTDITSILGIASNGLTSVGSFMKLMAERDNIRANTTKTEINSAQDAFTYAGDWLTGFDPATRSGFLDSLSIPDDATPDQRAQLIDAAIVSAFKRDIAPFGKTARAFVDKAFMGRWSDPRVKDQYYQAVEKAIKSRASKMSTEKVLGKLDLAEDVVRKQNTVAYDYLEKSFRSQIELNSIINSYNIAKTQNDWDYETWKQEKGIPEQVAESELQGYLMVIAKAKADAARAEAQQAWLNELIGYKKSKDPAAIYLFNALVQGGYAPLQSMSVSGGFGPGKVSSQWNQVIVPGSSMSAPTDNSIPGWNPYSGWDNK